jgi:hypothetical protein
VRPVLASADLLAAEGDARLFATHPVTIGIGFPDDGPGIEYASEQFSVPPGAVRASDDLASNAGVPSQGIGESAFVVEVIDAPGPLPVGVSWVQSDGTAHGRCSATTSTSLSLLPATPARLTRPKVTGGLPDESTVRLRLPAIGPDLDPLEIRYRAVKAERFPRAGVRPRVVAVPLAGGRPPHPVTVRTGGLRVRIEPQLDDLRTPVTFTFETKPSPGRGTRYGYDLQVWQGGRRASRLRAAGRCQRTGGFLSCTRKRLALD